METIHNIDEKNKKEQEKSDYYIITCPHCEHAIQIFKNEVACRVFRHGIYKKNFKQLPSHLDKPECDRLADENLIYGCGKPFILNKDNNAEICDYI